MKQWIVCAHLLTASLFALPQQQPTFRTATDVILVEATVVTRDGTPVADLRVEDFDVRINGRRRQVVSAEFRPSDAWVSSNATVAAGPVTPTGTNVVPVAEGRTIVVAVDEYSVPAGAQAAAREAVTRIVDAAHATDALGLVAMPGPLSIAPSRDHAAVRHAIGRIGGRRVDLPRHRFNLSPTEAVALRARESLTTTELLQRECRSEYMNPGPCHQEVFHAATAMAEALEQQGLLTIDGLHAAMDALATLPGRKTLFVVSAGLPTSTRAGARPNLSAATQAVARRAAEVNIQLYVLYLNVHFLEGFSVATGWRSPSAVYNDIGFFANGLERFADSAGGSLFQVEVDSDPFVARAYREISGSYALAVRPDLRDHDGKVHDIRVTVSRSGATVKHRRMVVIPLRESNHWTRVQECFRFLPREHVCLFQ